MPYRRLPNTDAARIRALKGALTKGQDLEIDTIAYSFALKQKIEFFLPKFEVAIQTSNLAKEKQFGNSFRICQKSTIIYLALYSSFEFLHCQGRNETICQNLLRSG